MPEITFSLVASVITRVSPVCIVHDLLLFEQMVPRSVYLPSLHFYMEFMCLTTVLSYNVYVSSVLPEIGVYYWTTLVCV